MLSRGTLAKVWIIFMFFIVVTIPLQYAIVIGLPPDLCISKQKYVYNFLLNFFFKYLLMFIYINWVIFIMYETYYVEK